MFKKEKDSAASFGGGETRLIYEGKKKPAHDKFIIGILISVITVLFAFAVIGVISLTNGSFNRTENTADKDSIKVPTNAEISGNGEIETVISDTANSVVVIEIKKNDGSRVTKLGFFITLDGYIATENTPGLSDAVSITAYHGGESAVASFVGSVPGLEIAYLKIGIDSLVASKTPVVNMGNSTYVKAGQSIWGVPASSNGYMGFCMHGNIAGIYKHDFTVTEGEKKSYNIIYTDFEINETLSGAPLINNSGEVIGMCAYSLSSPVKGCGVSVPINTVVLLFNEILIAK